MNATAAPFSQVVEILLVEDNEDNRIVYSTMLRHHGFRVCEALDGEEGIAKAHSERPDIILMDISIPLIDAGSRNSRACHVPTWSCLT